MTHHLESIEQFLAKGDYSIEAASLLEAAMSSGWIDEARPEEIEELCHVLASYRPGGGEFLYDEQALHRACVAAERAL